MSQIECLDCLTKIDSPDDIMVGEIIECPDCGLELEVESIDGDNLELKRLAIEKEDWGE